MSELDFTNPTSECDLVMKGGTTSGIVYPFAINEIASEYRLRSIAGTSAGAIAATLAAAAEYRRQNADSPEEMGEGFDQIERIASDLAQEMMSLLHPSNDMAPVYEAFKTFLAEELAHRKDLKRRYEAGENVDVDQVRPMFERVKNPFLVLYATWGRDIRYKDGKVRLGFGGAFRKFGLNFGKPGRVLVGLLSLRRIIRIAKELNEKLAKNDYGVLPGTTQSHYNSKKPGVIDWLADEIDRVAGHWTADGAPDQPLLIGDLSGYPENDEEPNIRLATITTDLTSQRPYQLPLQAKDHYYFDPDELRKVLPGRIVNWMVGHSQAGKKRVVGAGQQRDLYPVPVGDHFPVILAARMSLSFPLLIQAVPLWRQDYLPHAEEQIPWVRCLFSDGGLSSNLPVHLFDAWLPRRPTFAISLGGYEKQRHGSEWVHFSGGVPNPRHIDAIEISNVFGFLFALLTGAKDWQDKLQSKLPGFSERIATVRLQSHEGNQNLNMEPETIKELQARGGLAGQKIKADFDFTENRWRRALSILPNVDASIQRLDEAYLKDIESGFHELFKTTNSQAYPTGTEWNTEELIPYVDGLAALSGQAPDWADKDLPHADAALRLVSNLDLTEG